MSKSIGPLISTEFATAGQHEITPRIGVICDYLDKDLEKTPVIQQLIDRDLFLPGRENTTAVHFYLNIDEYSVNIDLKFSLNDVEFSRPGDSLDSRIMTNLLGLYYQKLQKEHDDIIGWVDDHILERKLQDAESYDYRVQYIMSLNTYKDFPNFDLVVKSTLRFSIIQIKPINATTRSPYVPLWTTTLANAQLVRRPGGLGLIDKDAV